MGHILPQVIESQKVFILYDGIFISRVVFATFLMVVQLPFIFVDWLHSKGISKANLHPKPVKEKEDFPSTISNIKKLFLSANHTGAFSYRSRKKNAIMKSMITKVFIIDSSELFLKVMET